MLIWTRSIGQDRRGLSARMMTPQASRLSAPKHLTCQRKKHQDLTACHSLLSPTRGRLKGRLDHETRTHMPLPPLTVNAACQLHRWAHKETHPVDKVEGANVKPSGSRPHVMQCEECGVHLCIKCWPIFHRERRIKLRVFDILEEKDASATMNTK
jgi:hypothetical protein